MARTHATLTLLLLVLSAALVQCIETQNPADTIQRRDDPLNCRTRTSNDLYGLGLRLGYYSNWLAAWVANNWVPDEIVGAQDSNSIFLLALLASMVRTTVVNTITRLDALILLELCAGTTLSVVTIWGYRTCIYSTKGEREGLHGISLFGGFGTHFRLLLTLAVAVYALWFFGIAACPNNGRLSVSGDPGICPTIYVLSRSLPLASNSIRYPALILASIATFYCGLMVLSTPLALVTRLKKFSHLRHDGFHDTSTRLRYITGASTEELARLFLLFRTFNLLCIIFAMIFIEFTLHLNHVDAVIITDNTDGEIATPAQLLPLLIGIFSLIRILYLAYEYFRASDGDVRPPQGITPSFNPNHYHHGIKQKPTGWYRALKWKLQLFSTSIAINDDEHHNNDAVAEKEQRTELDLKHIETIRCEWSPTQKWLITYLPWLSLVYFWPWRNGDEQRLVEGFPLHNDNNENNGNQRKSSSSLSSGRDHSPKAEGSANNTTQLLLPLRDDDAA